MATACSELGSPEMSKEKCETHSEKTQEEQKDPEGENDEPGNSTDATLENAKCRKVDDGDVKSADEAVAAEAVVVTAATVSAGDEDAEQEVLGCELSKSEENSPALEEQTVLADGEDTSETVVDDGVKEIKPEPREESQSPVTVLSDCLVKSKGTTSDDAPEPTEEKTSTGGGDRGELAVTDKRRASVEMSSSDGEPLSRMDSEDSVSSTLMDMESTVSSGRSTPAMMNGQGSASQCHPGAKGPAAGYGCSWDQCGLCFTCSPDLAEHIRGVHVDGQRGGVFVCLWQGCKVYNTPSTSHSWLQRHMLTHSGDKPFKCVVGGCSASFASQGGLARHVPTHFSQQSSSKLSSQARLKEESPNKAGLNKRKKRTQLNKRRRSLPRPHDFFDAQTMDAIRHRAICLNLATHMESTGSGHSVVFHSTVTARRKEGSGKVKVLLHWTPEDILPDVWVNETERCQLKTKVVHLSQLPQDTAVLLDPNIYRALPQKRLKRSL
ncbi:zinc finger protein aebp2 isoform X2 [Esox lucius]|uniref:zinc finger protein aebp2 isoform X2 n=1 Tax=Esox lucius TaxID=8010 RepID=UPI000575F1E9|nr:zinc finger protein aebp2 isoform X2 [Esox lucius]